MVKIKNIEIQPLLMSRMIVRLSIVVLSVAIVCALMAGIPFRSHGAHSGGIIMLVKAEALTNNTSFPYDMAGLSAYVNVGQSLDLEKIGSIFCQLERVGDNYVVGQVAIDDYGGDIKVHLYADKSGWIVAFIGKDEPVADLISWNDIDTKNGVIEYTTLEKAIKMACDAVGIDYDSIKSNIKYYDFEYPDANGVAMFVRVVRRSNTNYTHFALPSNATIFEVSYYHWEYSGISNVIFDGKIIDNLNNYHCYEYIKKIDNLSVDVGAHTIGIQETTDWGRAGVGVVLVYRV